MAAGPVDDTCAPNAIYPTGCDDPPPSHVLRQTAALIDVGSIAYPARQTAISCMNPGTLQSILAQEQRSPSADLDALQNNLLGNGCSMNGTDLGWRVIATSGRYAQVQLIAGPSLIMWFDRADLAASPSAMSGTQANDVTQ